MDNRAEVLRREIEQLNERLITTPPMIRSMFSVKQNPEYHHIKNLLNEKQAELNALMQQNAVSKKKGAAKGKAERPSKRSWNFE